MLSVIVPAYNEGQNIQATLRNLERSLDALGREHESIVVSDGSTDDTATRAKALKLPHVRVVSYPKNRGKGYALTVGTNESKGEMVTFLDAGGDFPAGQIDKFIKLMEVFDADVVIGSKRHPASRVNYPLGRQIGSRLYQLLIRILFNLNIRDTQTGLKLFKRDVLVKCLPRALVKRYAFDLELLVIAKHLGYRRFFEAPVEMDFNAISSSLTNGAIVNALVDTAAIWYRLRILRYYDRPHVTVTQ
jgi:glycosyltransferase involved in cell wall biosynthesis